MLRFAADENFKYPIVEGLRKLIPNVDILTAREAGKAGATDPHILEWAAVEGRIVLSHDVKTMTDHAYGRLAVGKKMPGVILVGHAVSVRTAIDELLIAIQCGRAEDWNEQVRYLPL